MSVRKAYSGIPGESPLAYIGTASSTNQRDALGTEAGPGISARHMSRGAAFGDFDNDGDIDVLIMNVNEPPTLLRNDAPPGNHWINIRLEGTKSNRSAIGSHVLVR